MCTSRGNGRREVHGDRTSDAASNVLEKHNAAGTSLRKMTRPDQMMQATWLSVFRDTT